MNWKKLLPLSLLVLTIIAAMMLAACDDRSGNPVTHKIARMKVTPSVIYADNNITYSTVWVYVKDSNGFPVPGQSVSFKSSLGTIEANKNTDSSGVAEALFWDSGEDGTAEIWAFVGGDSRKDTVRIEIAPEIDQINMAISSTTMKVNTTSEVSATVINALGNIVDDGTIVVFDCDLGYFTDNAQGSDLGTRIQATTSNGIASVTYNSGTQKGAATVKATVSTKSASTGVTINPGTGISIDLQTPIEPIAVGAEVPVVAYVYDAFNNAVKPQTVVNFSTDLGSVPPSAATDETGAAHITFSSGAASGLATITAAADSASATGAISILSDDVASIVFPNTPVLIYREGSGGVQSAQLAVTLRDQNGNVVDEDRTVWFGFGATPPTGCNLNNDVFAMGDSVGVPALSGTATVSVNAGLGSGAVNVSAWTYTDEGHRIASNMANIAISSGVPYEIDLNIGEYNSGEEYGSGSWRVGLAAHVTDDDGNPVPFGTAVTFSLESDIDSVTVYGYGYTGNMSVDGDSLQGVAFSWVAYDGSHSNDYVEIRAASGDVSTVFRVQLPMNQPILECNPIEGHLDWVNNSHSDLIGEILCVVRDNQGNYIHDAIIQCFSVRGEFINPEPEYQTDMGPEFIKTNYLGRAIARILFHEYECPPVNPPPNEVPVDCTFVLLGTEVTDTGTIILLNYNTE